MELEVSEDLSCDDECTYTPKHIDFPAPGFRGHPYDIIAKEGPSKVEEIFRKLEGC